MNLKNGIKKKKEEEGWLIQRMKFVNQFFWSITSEFRNIFVLIIKQTRCTNFSNLFLE